MPAADWDPPPVLVSIVNHENRDLVAACIRSLPLACNGLDWRVCVVDNRSEDGSLEMLARDFPDVQVIANRTRLGFGANHNQVLRPLLAAPGPLIPEAQADRAPVYVLVLNDDTVLEPDAVTRMVGLLEARPAVAAVVPTVRTPDGQVAASRIAYPNARTAWREDWSDRTEPPDAERGYLQGCCLLLRRAALEEVGPFDERFFLFYEDVDLSRRLVDAGWTLAVCPEAVVEHLGHASVFKPELAASTPRQGRRSRYLYLRKHRGWAKAEFITGVGRLLLLIRAAKASAGVVVRHDPTRASRRQRLWALARLNPRRPVPPDPRAAPPA